MFDWAAKTQRGSGHELNEDSIGSDSERGLWLVADGMGGHARGEVASGIVKDTILEFKGGSGLREALLRAHGAVVSAAALDASREGMGSTAVAAKIEDRMLEIAWVGDSRAYLWRDQCLQQLTRDHSFVEGLREQYGLTHTQVRSHPQSHVLTQTIGRGTPSPDVSVTPLRTGDWVLLCSDGLPEVVSDEQIGAVLSTCKTAVEATEALVATAVEHDARDDVSVVVVDYQGASAPVWRAGWARHRALLLPVLIGTVAAGLVATLLWWYWGER